jgi:hypothetical protein
LVHRRHQRANLSRRRRRRKKRDPNEPEDHAIGTSRGGNTTKIQIICDSNGIPLHFELAAGQRHEASFFDDVMIGADQNLWDSEGDPIPWPKQLSGDKGYRAAWIDEYIMDLEITPVIPSKSNETHADRPVDFDAETYKRRNCPTETPLSYGVVEMAEIHG